MQVLSFLATVVCVLYIVVIVRRYNISKYNDRMNVFAILVCTTLGWWAFCDAFFYSAPTKEIAWLFHRLSSIGWCGFIGVTAYFFLIMIGADKKISALFKLIYWIIPTLITFRFVLYSPTALDKDLVLSS